MLVEIDRARRFLLANARLLERHLFAFHFEGAGADPVLRALRAYAGDGGLYGHGLEPDKRAPASQPVDQAVALAVLDEVAAPQAAFVALCDGLAALTTPEGGLPFSHPSVMSAPHAPWWDCARRQTASINPTGDILARLWKNGISHPWMDRAEAFCWRALDDLSPEHPHALANALAFLSAVPDRTAARAPLDRLRGLIRTATRFEPGASGYVFSPLTFAPLPDSPARAFYSEAEISADLNCLAASQAADGGFQLNWPALSPGVEAEARGIVTLRALRSLTAYGRWRGAPL